MVDANPDFKTWGQTIDDVKSVDDVEVAAPKIEVDCLARGGYMTDCMTLAQEETHQPIN